WTHFQRGRLLQRWGKAGPAQASFGEAIQLQDALAKDFPGQPNYLPRTVRFRFELANALDEARKTEKALDLYREALRRQDKVLAAYPRSAQEHNYQGLIADSLGSSLGERTPDEGQRLMEQALRARRKAWELGRTGRYADDLRRGYYDLASFLLRH